MIFGVGLCFFGGVYFAAIAAIEAAHTMGGQDMYNHLQIVWEDGCVVAEASAQDDQVDANKDGIVDVEQMSWNELVSHKALVAAKAVKDPQRVQQAAMSLWILYCGVLATLKSKFAQTVFIALGIAQQLSLP